MNLLDAARSAGRSWPRARWQPVGDFLREIRGGETRSQQVDAADDLFQGAFGRANIVVAPTPRDWCPPMQPYPSRMPASYSSSD